MISRACWGASHAHLQASSNGWCPRREIQKTVANSHCAKSEQATCPSPSPRRRDRQASRQYLPVDRPRKHHRREIGSRTAHCRDRTPTTGFRLVAVRRFCHPPIPAERPVPRPCARPLPWGAQGATANPPQRRPRDNWWYRHKWHPPTPPCATTPWLFGCRAAFQAQSPNRAASPETRTGGRYPYHRRSYPHQAHL